MSRSRARWGSRACSSRSGCGTSRRGVRRDAGSCSSRRSGRGWSASRLRAHGRRRSRSCRDRLRRRLLRSGRFLGFCRFFSFLSRSQAAEMLAHQFRVLQVNRARVRLFFRDTGFREVVNQDFRLNLQFPRQLVTTAQALVPALSRIYKIPQTTNCSYKFRDVTARRLFPVCRSRLRALLR